MKKQQFEKYYKQAERTMLDYGYRRSVVSDKTIFEWLKDTAYGRHGVNIDTDHKSGVVSIFTRFYDVEKAARPLEAFGGNTYSGKCNIHAFDCENALNELDTLLAFITPLQPPQ